MIGFKSWKLVRNVREASVSVKPVICSNLGRLEYDLQRITERAITEDTPTPNRVEGYFREP